MSLFHFTRQEQIAILFLSGGLLVGAIVTLVKHYRPGFAPELILEQRIDSLSTDTVPLPNILPPAAPAESLGFPVSGRLDINRATLEELVNLPGIGPRMAERIIAYRTTHGRFRTPNDLKGVHGIGDKTLDRLKPLLDFD
jgi:competence ComEA-like helix-hairpin-helix protein